MITRLISPQELGSNGYFIQPTLPRPTMTSTSELAGYEAQLMNDDLQWTEWRSAGAATLTIEATFDSVQAIDALVIEGGNIDTAIAQLVLFPADGAAETVLQLNELDTHGDHHLIRFDPIKVIRAELRLTGALNNARISYLAFGETLTPGCNFTWNPDYAYHSEQSRVRSRHGYLFTDSPAQYRMHNLTWQTLDIEDVRKFEEMIRRYGKNRDLVFVPYPQWPAKFAELTRRTFRGRMQDMIGPVHERLDRFAMSILFEELTGRETAHFLEPDYSIEYPGLKYFMSETETPSLTTWLEDRHAPTDRDLVVVVPRGYRTGPVGAQTTLSKYQKVTLQVDGELLGNVSGAALTIGGGTVMDVVNNGAIRGGGGNGGAGGRGGFGSNVGAWSADKYVLETLSYGPKEGPKYDASGGGGHITLWRGNAWGNDLWWEGFKDTDGTDSIEYTPANEATTYFSQGGYRFHREGSVVNANTWKISRQKETQQNTGKEYFWDTSSWKYAFNSSPAAMPNGSKYVAPAGFGNGKTIYGAGMARGGGKYAIRSAKLAHGVAGVAGAGGLGLGWNNQAPDRIGKPGTAGTNRAGAGGKGGNGGAWGAAGATGATGATGLTYGSTSSAQQHTGTAGKAGGAGGKAIHATAAIVYGYSGSGQLSGARDQ